MDVLSKYLKMYPHMINEDIPKPLNEFCEFIIQQNAEMADKYFKANKEIAQAFLEYFKPTTDEVFYRDGHTNFHRDFLSASDTESVGLNFAKHASNNSYCLNNRGNGIMMELTSELHYKTLWTVDGESEVFLVNPKVIREYKVK